jgi:hypothetical protein
MAWERRYLEASGRAWSRDGLHFVACIKRNAIARVCEREERECWCWRWNSSLGSRKGDRRGSAEGATAVLGKVSKILSCCEHHDDYHPYQRCPFSMVTSDTCPHVA